MRTRSYFSLMRTSVLSDETAWVTQYYNNIPRSAISTANQYSSVYISNVCNVINNGDEIKFTLSGAQLLRLLIPNRIKTASHCVRLSPQLIQSEPSCSPPPHAHSHMVSVISYKTPLPLPARRCNLTHEVHTVPDYISAD